jgi:hypothetical protein
MFIETNKIKMFVERSVLFPDRWIVDYIKENGKYNTIWIKVY